MSAETSTRRWASSGQPVAKVTNRAKTAIPKDQKISLSLLQKTNGMTRPHTAVINNTMQERPTSGRPTSGRPTSGRPTSGRPVSGRTRPLSGRVFLQKTVMRGWVARSTTDLDIDDVDEDDYDDDWEDELTAGGSDTMLDGLLSSKKIMDSKRAQHIDWNAGEVAIPTFHCPRCRDHWYGLTSHPCDEELARLIREGLWYTGQGPVDRDLLFKTGHRSGVEVRTRGERSSDSSDGLKLPPIVQRSESDTSLSSSSRSLLKNKQEKKGKRISFNLEHEEFQYERDKPTRSGSLNPDQMKGKKSLGGYENGDDSDTKGRLEGEDGHTERNGRNHSLVELDGSSKPNCVGSNVDELSFTDNPSQISNGDGFVSGSGSLGSNLRNLDPNNIRAGNNLIGLSSDCGSNFRRSQTASSNDDGRDPKLGKKSKLGLSNGSEDSSGSISNGSLANGKNLTLNGGNLHSGSKKWEGSQKSLSDDSEKHKSTGNSNSSLSDFHKRERNASGGESDSDGEGKGGGKLDLRHADRGKNVRVSGAGFIARASSPTGSEWGDPTHALAYISNTTSSSRAGSSLGGRIQDDKDLGKTHSDPQLIKVQQKPKLTADDLIVGPMFTRAFTFSYYKNTREDTKGSKETLAKSTKNGKKRR